MLLTITTTAEPGTGPATDLGFLLHKNPERVQQFETAAGQAHVFYPEATPDRCTAALLLEVDPVALVRGRHGPDGGEGFSLGQYVNDRPYAASSLLAVAMSRVFKTAMSGRCAARPQLAETALPLRLRLPALPCRGGAGRTGADPAGPDLAGRLFGPLGWQVDARPIALDEKFPDWGDSRYVDLRLAGRLRLADALNHLYVLLPVLDDAKHYWVGPDEVDKLVRAGGGWLAGQPDQDLISRRYLAHRAGLFRPALDRLAAERLALDRLAESDDAPAGSFDNAIPAGAEAGPETDAEAGKAGPGPDAPDPLVPLAEQRRGAVLAVLRAAGARRVADLGCGQGTLTAALLADQAFTHVIAGDVSARALEVTERRLRLDQMSERQRERITLVQTSLTYTDRRLGGLDAAVLMEVIEHVDPSRLPALERSVFADAAPGLLVVTTPNAEYNAAYEFLASGSMRHPDHRFEWTRAQFGGWAARVAAEHGYDLRFLPVGPEDPELGPPTQLAVFARTAAARTAAGGTTDAGTPASGPDRTEAGT
ncbi:MAG: 3' terminal RNA ribose 2'-O-methyltransferase Hen1 [Streptosporangiaceae bacterium]